MTDKGSCKECGNYVPPARIKIPNKDFCGTRCRSRYNTREYRKRIGKAAVNEQAAKWRLAHPERLKENQRKRSIKQRGFVYDITRIKTECPYCKEEFSPRSKLQPNQKFCSARCRSNFNRVKNYRKDPERHRAKSRKHPPAATITKYCLKCDTAFTPSKYQPTWMQYCSSPCLRRAVDKRYYEHHRNDRILKSTTHKHNRRSVDTLYKLSKNDLIYIRQRDSNKCVYCHDDLTDKPAAYDHIVPLNPREGERGNNSRENIVISCLDCNRYKTNIELDKIFNNAYFKRRNITQHTIEPKVYELLKRWKEQKKLLSS